MPGRPATIQPRHGHGHIQLASGKINDDDLRIELIEAAHGGSARVTIHWPTHPTVVNSASLDAVIAMATRTLANAVIELARLRNGREQ